MHVRSTSYVHDLDSPWPAFLDLLDSDPRAALDGFHRYSWKLFQIRPPSVLSRLDSQDRDDLIADLVLSCCQDDFRKLRKYQNVGKPFAAWLSTVLVRQVLDWFKRQRPTDEFTDDAHAMDEQPFPVSPKLAECLNQCLSRMSEKCQAYLSFSAHGLKPSEIAVLLHLPEGDNKRVSDDLRHCMKRLREELLKAGMRPLEVI